jgi:putative DNA primase/helicase
MPDSIVPGSLTPQHIHAHALEYVERGWAVFLLATDGEGGKVPPRNCSECDWRREPRPPRHDPGNCGHLLCHGFHAATLDPARFTQMLEALPTGHLAIRTGRASRLLVVDAEAHARPGEPTGLEVLDEWEAWTAGKAGSLPYTLRARSVSGGQHWYYRLPDGTPLIRSGRVVEGVDVKAENGYVGSVAGDGRREWLNPGVEVATAPAELLEWLSSGRRIGVGGHGGGAAAPGYDFDAFLRDGCPDGHRDYFINDLIFRLRKRGNPPLTLEELTRRVEEAWLRVAQPPEARYEMPWEDVEYKIERVWAEVTPDERDGVAYSWPGVLQPREDGITEVTRVVEGVPPPPDADLTETGNAHRFTRLFAEKALYVPGIGWHTWDGTAWTFDELNDIFDSTQHVLEDIRREAVDAPEEERERFTRWRHQSSTMNARTAMLRGAAADPRMKTSVDSLNSDPFLLVVRNGTLDLRTRRRRDSEPGDRNTQVAGTLYDPEARCPRWEDHVKLITGYSVTEPDATLAAFTRRWAGYSLTGLVTEQKFFFGYGGGANGKNALIETLLALLGTYATRSSSKLLLSDSNEHETIVARLSGARMVFIDETPKGKINEARLKELTGSETITARLMRKDYFDFEMRAKLWIAGNNKPRVGDTSRGFWRRLDLVPFDVTIPEERRLRDFLSLLREELPGILNWCLEGLRDYLEVGLAVPDRVKRAGEEYREEENTFAQFVAECFERDSVERVWHPNNALHWAYKQWCESIGMKPPGMQQLANEWQRAGFHREEKVRKARQGMHPAEKQAVQRGWVGPPLSVSLPHQLVWQGDRTPRS